jgi:hypothetical protein
MQPVSTALDPTLHSPRVREIKSKLLARTIGQDQAVNKLCGILETFFTGYNDPRRPISVVLELGPTGTGKTRSRRPAGQPKPRAYAWPAASHWLPARRHITQSCPGCAPDQVRNESSSPSLIRSTVLYRKAGEHGFSFEHRHFKQIASVLIQDRLFLLRTFTLIRCATAPFGLCSLRTRACSDCATASVKGG